MGWEPLPLEIADWMGMDDDYLRAREFLAPRDAGVLFRHAEYETPDRQ